MGNELTEDKKIHFKFKQVQNTRDQQLYKKKNLIKLKKKKPNPQEYTLNKYREKLAKTN